MKYLKAVLFIFVLIVIDQLLKLYFVSKDSFVSNSGSLFGLFKGVNFLFIIISVIVISVVIYFYNVKKLRLGFNFVLAGAFGNLIDRVFRGNVIDFIDFKVWPVFNLADVFVVAGVVILIYRLVRKD